VYDKLCCTASTTEFRRIPEPIDPLPQFDRNEARQVLGVPADGRYVATAGLLDARKGIDLLLGAFARAKLQPDDRLLLVGQLDKVISDLITRDYGTLLSAGRLVIVDRYVKDFELGCCYLAADVLVAPHPRQIGSSGTLVRAAVAKRPLIASNYGWMGWATQTFELGTTVDVANQEAYVAAIESTLNNSQIWQQSERAARFCQYHTTKNQKAHWLISLARERGVAIGEYANRIEWSWVTDARG
jgi:glycosyltransferase involved in cell wall biosynthesis